MGISYEAQVSYDEEEGNFKYNLKITNGEDAWTSPDIAILSVQVEDNTPTMVDWSDAKKYVDEQMRGLDAALRRSSMDEKVEMEHHEWIAQNERNDSPGLA